MSDKVYQKQLEKFGIEQNQIVEPDLVHERRKIHFESTIGITKAIMSTMEGRQWIYNKLDFCCVFSTPFVAGKPDATAFLCGLQEFGHHLLKEVMIAASNEYSLMLQEAAAREQNVPQKKEED